MFESLRNHMSHGFIALEEFLYPSEEEEAIEPMNAKIRDMGLESGLFDSKTGQWMQDAGVLSPCGHDFSINAYNNLWFWFSQKIVDVLAAALPPQEKRISTAEKTAVAFTWFQNKCRICDQRADEIVPNYALRNMIDILRESAGKESIKVEDVWEKIKDPITLRQMKDPIIQSPCGHSICASVWEDPAFEQFKNKCQECKRDCDKLTENKTLKAALRVLNKHFLHEMGFQAQELAKLSHEDIWNTKNIYLENPEHLLALRDAAISVDSLSKLAPFIQTKILRNPDHFTSLLKGAEMSMEDFSDISIFDQSTALAAELTYGVSWLKAAL